MNLAAFAAIVEAALAEAEGHGRERMERACRLVETEAKREIGTYQGAAGPFGAWPELAERTKADRSAQGYSENEPGLRSGEMRDSITHTVHSHHEGEIGSNSKELLWFELGTNSQPPRSVLGIAAVHEEKKVVDILGPGTVRTLIGGGSETEF